MIYGIVLSTGSKIHASWLSLFQFYYWDNSHNKLTYVYMITSIRDNIQIQIVKLYNTWKDKSLCSWGAMTVRRIWQVWWRQMLIQTCCGCVPDAVVTIGRLTRGALSAYPDLTREQHEAQCMIQFTAGHWVRRSGAEIWAQTSSASIQCRWLMGSRLYRTTFLHSFWTTHLTNSDLGFSISKWLTLLVLSL